MLLSLSRRRLVGWLGSLAGLGALGPRGGRAASEPIRVGAIRWDAWYGQTQPPLPGFYACRNVAPREYRFRAPWFATPAGADRLICDGDQQATMDAEIGYARKAGIKYWAYAWYKPGSAMLDAWSLHQASRTRDDVNWTMIVGYGQFHADMGKVPGYWTPDAYAGFFTQPNFEKTPSGRPLVYLLADRGATPEPLAKSVTVLREAAARAGAGRPYVVVMSSSATKAAADARTMGADAISAYAYAPPASHGSYAALSRAVQAFWSMMAATGLPVIPIAMTGWDRRPRIAQPVPWERSQKPYAGMDKFYDTATPAQIAGHVAAMLGWMAQNARVTPARRALIYAWDEFDEGGWLCPTWTPHGPDTSRIEALSKVLS